jgi:hypothetical protein
VRTPPSLSSYLQADRGHSAGAGADAGVGGAACDGEAMRVAVDALGRSGGVGMGAGDAAGAGENKLGREKFTLEGQ